MYCNFHHYRALALTKRNALWSKMLCFVFLSPTCDNCDPSPKARGKSSGYTQRLAMREIFRLLKIYREITENPKQQRRWPCPQVAAASQALT